MVTSKELCTCGATAGVWHAEECPLSRHDLPKRAALEQLKEQRPSKKVTGPPFTVDRYGTFADCVIAERDWLRMAERLNVETVARLQQERDNWEEAFKNVSAVASELSQPPVVTPPAEAARKYMETIAALTRDAERYRFLRHPDNAIVYSKDRNAWGAGASGHVRYDTPEQLDAAVDTARAAVTKGEGRPDGLCGIKGCTKPWRHPGNCAHGGETRPNDSYDTGETPAPQITVPCYHGIDPSICCWCQHTVERDRC